MPEIHRIVRGAASRNEETVEFLTSNPELVRMVEAKYGMRHVQLFGNMGPSSSWIVQVKLWELR